jgi:hypothetical protein
MRSLKTKTKPTDQVSRFLQLLMKIIIERIDTGVALPPQKFTTELKDILENCSKMRIDIQTIHSFYRKLQQETKTNAPNFKIEMWYAWIDEANRELNIRYGHGGEPQIIVKEVVQ